MSRSTSSRLGAGRAAGPLVAFLVALAALLAAGCGGETRLTKTQYEQRVRAAYADVQRAFLATKVDSLQVLALRVGAAQSSLRRAASRLDSAAPPKEIAEPNDRLIEGMRSYAEDLDPLRAAAARGDRTAVDRLRAPKETAATSEEGGEQEIENDPVEAMAEAVEEMTREGFDLGRIAKE